MIIKIKIEAIIVITMKVLTFPFLKKKSPLPPPPKKSKEERDDEEGDKKRHRERVRDSESETDRQAKGHTMMCKKSMQNPNATYLRIKNLSANFIFWNYSSSYHFFLSHMDLLTSFSLSKWRAITSNSSVRHFDKVASAPGN